MYLRARTLFFVVLFSNIYKQRHTSTRHIIDNELLLNTAKFLVCNRCGFIRRPFENTVKNIFNNIISLRPSKTRQKIAIITTYKEISEEPAAGSPPLLKNMGCYESYFKSRKFILNKAQLPFVSAPDSLIEITLIKANFI